MWERYRRYLLQHCQAAVSEVREQVNVNQFWTDVLSALKADAFGKTAAERRRVFKVHENKRAPSPVSVEQQKAAAESPFTAWTSYILYFQPGPVLDMLRRHKRAQGQELPLDKNDLRAQMKTRDYWVPPKVDVHRQRFEGSKGMESCWCVNVDLHPLGLQKVSEEDFKASLLKDGGLFVGSAEWIDPRRGDLFALIDSLRPPPETETEAS